MESDEDHVGSLGNGKKRARNPDTWKCNVRKAKKLKGEQYTTVRGKTIPEISIVSPVCR